MEDTYEKSYVEVLEILKYIPHNEYIKIPKEKIDFYEEYKDKNYHYTYDCNSPVVSKKANAILVNLYEEYIADEEEKKKIKEILKLNTQKVEDEKRKKYNVNDLFKKTKKVEETALTDVITEKWYKKIIKFLKKLCTIPKK